VSHRPLAFLLAAKPDRVEPNLEQLRSDAAQRASRFWAGKSAGSQAKAACVERIVSAWSNPKRVADVVGALRPEERAVLAVVRRYGGFVSGTLLSRELLARGIVKEPKPGEAYSRRTDPVHDLCANLLLIEGYRDCYSFGYSREYSNVSLPSRLAAHVEPAPALGWKASAPLEKAPESTSLRAPAQLLVDLEQVARALGGQGRWKVNQGGALAAAVRNKLGKLLPAQTNDPLEPPDRAVLEYCLLCAMGVAQFDGAEGWLVPGQADSLAQLPHDVRASSCIRAWMTLRTWQDGIGAVPDRDNREESTRIDPGTMHKARELLVWALTRVAHSPCDWLDLETFLLDLYAAIGERSLSFYWHGYTWHPKLAAAAGKEQFPAGLERSRAFWMDDAGVWVANALLSTFVHLGVVERGRSGGPRSERRAFRLTEIGKAVFGAPEVQLPKSASREQCLTVQPNHEVLLYLDGADGASVTTLGRIATRESRAGVVQSFKLTRESVYGALQAGMTPGEIDAFLTTRSRTGLPPNVAHSLAEWSRKRDALVVREAVALGVGLPEGQLAVRGRAVGAGYVVASARGASKGANELGIGTEPVPAARTWQVDEHGVVSAGVLPSLVGLARLRRFAIQSGSCWQITQDSVRRARELGISVDQILGWLREHVSHGAPPLLANAIRNWAGGRGKVFLGEVVLLQVNDPMSFDALRRSRRLQPLLKGTLAGGCLVVAAEKRGEVAKILAELGFSLDAACRLDAEG